jgi:tRNA(Leu) C34 or U34 (ribose-2'-O)-methylase TrmL
MVLCDGTAEIETWKLQSWGLACLAWKIDELWYVDACKGDPLSTVQFHARALKARQVDSLEAGLAAASDLQPVLVEGPRRLTDTHTSLWAYRHPPSALYVFGGDRASSLPASLLAHQDMARVYIPAVRGVRAVQAGEVVAAHRYAQRELRELR